MEVRSHLSERAPGSGKDTYYREHLSHLPMLSLDEMRKSMKVTRGKSKQEGHLFQAVQEQFRQYLRTNQSFVFNATNLTTSLRAKWIRLATDYRAKVSCVYIEPEAVTLKHQNTNRQAPVPDKALINLFNILEVPHPLEFHSVNYVWS
jgi:predicted kinase